MIWRLDWQRVHQHFGFPALSLLIKDLQSLFPDKGQFTPWALFNPNSIPRPFASMLELPSVDIRIVIQSATFSLCSDMSLAFDEFLDQHGLADSLTKFIIPAAEVTRFRDQLDLAGIDERHLVPDLDGVAAELRRYYS